MVALSTAAAQEQLASLQQQVQLAQQQLESTDAAVAARRAAAAEAEQQLTSLKQDISVCEPKLASIKCQLQELEGNIKAREAEQQVNADRLYARPRWPMWHRRDGSTPDGWVASWPHPGHCCIDCTQHMVDL